MDQEGSVGRHGDGALDRTALGSALTCYTLWGLLPILFIWADRMGAGAFEVVAWRTLWSLPCAAGLAFATGGRRVLRGITRATLAMLLLSSALIAVNWSTYVWAVESGRTISASLGYYILPLLNMAIGAVAFRERITRLTGAAMGLAAVGVVLQGLALGEFPWVSIVLALSFGGYGVVRKIARVEALAGLLVECLILFLPAAAYAAWLASTRHGVFGVRLDASLLLAAAGPATALPLALFAYSARRLPLSVMGFLQFISPTLQFMAGVEAGEKLTPLRLLSFVFIWAGVAVFAAKPWLDRRRLGSAAAGGVGPD